MDQQKFDEISRLAPVIHAATSAVEDLVTSARLLQQFPVKADALGFAVALPVEGPNGTLDVNRMASKCLSAAAVIIDAVELLLSDGRETVSGKGEPSQGQKNDDGTYITVVQFYGTDEREWPGYGQDPHPGGDFIWAPNQPSAPLPGEPTAPWVWRPAFPLIGDAPAPAPEPAPAPAQA
ncbi:hypothetical protein UFOVP1382_63 [uncultured Caudovirales phage]|uniref:Uncharacterized protein n=1 Tax=uncultured Caudovirales phage TaxID=2100421 RepID=A0A6J5S3T0_9CAUD|nr:hypothetical protein UFOVP1382_63 [uncultured Caudovirales phage]